MTTSAKPTRTNASPSTCISANGCMRCNAAELACAYASSFSVSGPNVLRSIKPPGRKMRRHSAIAPSIGSNHGIARFDSMRSMESEERGWRSASPVTWRCLENQRGARDLASCSNAQTGSTDTMSALRNRCASWRAVAPVPDPRSRIRRGLMRMPSRPSSSPSRAICTIRANSGSPSPARANVRRTAMRSNTGRIACDIEPGSVMAPSMGGARAMRREPVADIARGGPGRKLGRPGNRMDSPPTVFSGLR